MESWFRAQLVSQIASSPLVSDKGQWKFPAVLLCYEGTCTYMGTHLSFTSNFPFLSPLHPHRPHPSPLSNLPGWGRVEAGRYVSRYVSLSRWRSKKLPCPLALHPTLPLKKASFPWIAMGEENRRIISVLLLETLKCYHHGNCSAQPSSLLLGGRDRPGEGKGRKRCSQISWLPELHSIS